VKTRLQVQGGNTAYNGTLHALKTIYMQEGFRGYYHGLNTALVSLVPNWMIYFTLYTESKRLFGRVLGREETPLVHVLSAMTAGASTNIITNPLWVLKTRFQTQTIGGGDVKYTGIFQGFARILREEGIQGLYRGLGPSLIGIIHVGVQFPLYEALKKYFCERGIQIRLNHIYMF
jgi:solute carrier family 25 folate transporter 32